MPPEQQAAPELAGAGRGARAREVLGMLRRRAWILAACALLIPTATYVAVALQPKRERATVIIQPLPLLPSSAIVSDSVPTGWFTAPGPSFLALVAGTPPVRIAVGRQVHRSPAAVGRISANTDSKTGWVTIGVTSRTSGAAIAEANAVATAIATNLQARVRRSLSILEHSVQQQLVATRDASKRQPLEAQLAALRRITPADQETLQVIEPAVYSEPVSNRPGLVAMIAFLFALLVGVWLARLVERADHRIHDPAVIEEVAERPILAALPRGHVASPEPFLRLRDAIVHLSGERDRTTLAIASPMRGEGRTSVALGLATAFAASGRSVVLVDADLRNPAVATRTGAPGSPGLAEVLSGSRLEDSLHAWDGPAGGLVILPAGSLERESPDRLASARMASVLRELSEKFDVVVLDTPPLLAVSDALPVAGQVSGVVVVVRVDHTPARALRRVVQVLTEAGADVLGAVATQVPAEATGRSPAPHQRKRVGRRLTLRAAGVGEPDARR